MFPPIMRPAMPPTGVNQEGEAVVAPSSRLLKEPGSGKGTPRALLLLDLEGKVVSVNSAALKSLGKQESEIVGKSLEALLERPRDVRLSQYFHRALRGSAVRCHARWRDGSKPAVDLRLRLHVVGANCTLEASWAAPGERAPDAPQESERSARQAAFETLFQAYLELQEINKQKTSMVAAATHELKTPLAVIGGACELLLSGGLGSLTQPQREIVALSQQNCRRLLNVVNSFLDYAAVERGKLTLRLESHNVTELLGDTLRYWRRLAQTRNVVFEYQPVQDDLPPLLCDRAKLQNVLNSLCDNAMKFTPAGGRVTLSLHPHFWERRLAEVTVPEERRNGNHTSAEASPKVETNALRFSVSDTGPGINPEFQQEIFEEYFQVPGGPSGGMGLGLAIARKIVAAHKGKIWVDSHPGQGATFSFVLPLWVRRES